jgi:hypothetical protein
VKSRADTLLGHCLARAYIERVGLEVAQSNATRKWLTTREMVKATPLASRTAGYVVLWATVMEDLGRDDLTVEDYIEAGFEPRRTAYKRNEEFRRLWPEFDNPNEIGRLLLDVKRRRNAALSATVEIELPALVAA